MYIMHWKHKNQIWISSQVYPIPMGYTKKYPKYQIPRWPESAAPRITKYTREILKNTKEKSRNRIVPFLALKQFCMISKVIGCIDSWGPNASFDTNIDIYTYGVCQSTIHVINVIYDIYDISDIYIIWHFTCIHISIWVSKEGLGPQECSQSS